MKNFSMVTKLLEEHESKIYALFCCSILSKLCMYVTNKINNGSVPFKGCSIVSKIKSSCKSRYSAATFGNHKNNCIMWLMLILFDTEKIKENNQM